MGIVAGGATAFLQRRVEHGLVLHFVAAIAALVGREERFELVLVGVVVLVTIQAFFGGDGAVNERAREERAVAVAASAILRDDGGF